MNIITIILVAALFGFLYGAHLEHENYLLHGDPSKFTAERTKKIMQRVDSSLRDRRECIAKDPSDCCNRDISREGLIAFHSKLCDKYHFTGPDGPRQARNRYVLLSTIAGILLFLIVLSKLRS